MSTFIEVQNRINGDFLNRSTFGDETKRAIKAAVRHYEYQRWMFNETSTALASSSSLSYITIPSNFLVLDDLRLTINGEDLPLHRRSPQTIRDWNTASTYGQPTDFAIYQGRIETFPIADSAYSVPIYYIKRLDVLSADSDTNEWIQGALEDVITYHATKLMWANVLRNKQEAATYAQFERDAYSVAAGERDQQQLTHIKATSF